MNGLKQLSVRKCSYFQVFVLFELCIISLFAIWNTILHGAPLNSLMLSSDGQFNDYFMHVGYASAPWGTNVYDFSTSACFPPLAYLMYGMLARIAGYKAIDPADIPSHKFVGNNLTIFVIYSIICIVLCIYAISLYQKKKGFVYQVLFPCILIVSYPFAFSSIQRGNSVLLVAVLMSIALIWKDDSSKLKRELAMIIIAICAGLKIYPAIFGLMYIKEKRIAETIRLAIYGIILFFVPFIFFGGLAGLQSFLNTVLNLNGEIHRCSVSGFVEMITLKMFGVTIPKLTFLAQHMFLLVSVIAFFMCKEKWKGILILCCVMAAYISSSWMYTCIFILPAMLMFFYTKDNKPIKINKSNWDDIIAFFLFMITFCIPIRQNYEFIYDSIIVLDAIFMIKIIISFFLNIKSRKKKNQQV